MLRWTGLNSSLLYSPLCLILLFLLTWLLPFPWFFLSFLQCSSYCSHLFLRLINTPTILIDFSYFVLTPWIFPIFVTCFLVIMHRHAGLLCSHQQMVLTLILCFFDVTASFLCLFMYKRTSVLAVTKSNCSTVFSD